MEAAMNRGSDLKLALACHDAGIFPSLYVTNMLVDLDTATAHEDTDYFDQIDLTLQEFKQSTGACDVVLAIDPEFFVNPKFLNIVRKHRVSHLEVFPARTPDNGYFWRDVKKKFGNSFDAAMASTIKMLSGTTQVLQRRTTVRQCPYNFGYTLKGSDGGGFSSSEYSTLEMFELQRALTPDAVIIPNGGVGTPQQVAYYINNGAAAVAVGTLLAASLESSLSLEAKQKFVSAKQQDLTKMPDTKQNTLVLGNKDYVFSEQSKADAQDWNRVVSLEAGLRTDGLHGHLYAGSGIDYVTEIKPVKQIVEYLVSELEV